MKRKIQFSGRFALTSVAFAALCLASPVASALGLGRLTVKSALGEAMQAEIEVTDMTAEEQANLKIRVAPPESYRAANVDYNPVLPTTRATLQKRADGRLFVRLVSDRGVQEPFVDVILEISWATGRLVREYTLLFDPPAAVRAAAPTGTTTSPVISAAPSAPEPLTPSAPSSTSPRQTAKERRDAARAAAAEARRSDAAAAQEARAAAGTGASNATPSGTGGGASGADEVQVRSGDTLSKIATRTQREGVSLDQMLVALFRANPSAFMGDNMNRLKSGVVLSVPSADTAQGITGAEAHKTIVAQSADFGAYRQRLAGSTLVARAEPSARQSTGKVQASVDDRKASAAPTPDKLTLSKGNAPGAATTVAEDKLSKDREKQAADARVAELNKNLNDLKKIQGNAATPAPAPVAVPAKPGTVPPVVVAAAPPPPPSIVPAPKPGVPPIVVPPIATPVAPPVVAPVLPASTALPSTPASMPAGMNVPPATVAATSAASAVVPPVVVTAPASAATPRPAPRVAAKPAPGLVDTIMSEPLYLIGGLIALLLAGFGIYRFSQRSKKDSGETSFLESRLQPDSFFGASGGQRIDTRDAGGSSSSMTYSLSQLDAIGDVDPVAEADVYLAYGRDLQAEEILKEAMRSNPERLAIRTKLLEVYAKRRDIKGFELLATQLFALTRGEGEEWAKTQELGAQIDPENSLYHAGGAPERRDEGATTISEPLGASTLPQSVVPVPSQFGSSVSDASVRDSQLDVDFDLDNPDIGMPSRPAPFDATESVPPRTASTFQSTTLKMPLTSNEPTAGPDHRDEPLAFDLSGIDLDKPAGVTAPAPSVGAIEMPFVEDDASHDPVSRKMELAEEFQRIGDKDGARDLLREVLTTASGATKTKAQAMLDDLS